MAKREQRKERVPVSGARDILTVKDKDPNYEYRFVLDVPGRLPKFQDGGWEVVTENQEVGQPTVDRVTQVGSAITKRSGTYTLVLMRIPKEWYDEDQAVKQDKVDALEESMQADLQRGLIPGTRDPAYGGSMTTRVDRKRG